jgi:hypothetical protein
MVKVMRKYDLMPSSPHYNFKRNDSPQDLELKKVVDPIKIS